MNSHSSKRPEHEAIFQRVREMVLFGEFLPGQPVTIMGLTEKLGAGVTPAREAIRRLTAEGALEALGNRRVMIPELSRAHLDEVALVRLSVEPELARRAAQHAQSAQIDALQALDQQIDLTMESGDARAYLETNYRFHFALYEMAQAPTLHQVASMMWVQMGPSLRVCCHRFGTERDHDNHRSMLAALRAGQPDDVAAAMRADITQGLDFVRQSLSE